MESRRNSGKARGGRAGGGGGGRAGGGGSARGSGGGRGAQARQLRIIAGRWRGRRWRFAHDAIRPTPDRVRETLFNWLQGEVEGKRCLDLYAGSGALGLEALSRGAANVDFVDRDARVIAALRETLAEFAGATPAGTSAAAPIGPGAKPAAQLHTGDALAWLDRATGRYDLVFIDPPYADEMQEASAARLASRGLVGPGSLVYLEAPRRGEALALPAGWELLKSGAAGEVGYHLYSVT